MNVLFISPHFPRHFYQFCERLKSRGVTVLGIGDCSSEGLGDNCRNALTDYRAVSSLMDYEAVYRIVAEYIYRYGRIDYVSSQNEYWLELEARIRTDFHIMTGPHVEELATMNRKSLMKARYEKAGVKAARWTLPTTLDDALGFASKVGYPVIVKPDKGVGAASTYKIHDAGELAVFNDWHLNGGNVRAIFVGDRLERFFKVGVLTGHIVDHDHARGVVLVALQPSLFSTDV